ncbi:MAG: O-antigen ligase family protein [Bacilli bacterium]|nr:O-antigen ligase family protein [Bacilli bacterium]
MNTYLKKNINTIISIFILISPIIDLITGISLHYNYNFTLGIIMRIIFLLLICYISVFIYKKKKLLIPYSIIVLYFILYILGIFLYKDQSVLLLELQRTIKVFYFPILLLTIYSLKDEIKISKLVLLVSLFLYLFAIFIPTVTNIGYKSYQITKKGTLGFFNSANEISGIISILTPIMFILLKESKSKLSRIFLIIMYLTVILMMGTKSPLLSLLITILFSIIYYWIYSIKNKKYKNLLVSIIIIIVFNAFLVVITPKTNFYKNIRTHLKFLHVKDIVNVVKDEKLIDHFIFSQRLTFLSDKAYRYKHSSTYEKLLGIGYYVERKEEKLIEMDYFDIYYSHGLIGFTIFFTITMYVLYKILDNKKTRSYDELMLTTSLLLIILLSFFTGHIITSPSVSLLCVIIIVSLEKRKKKNLLLASQDINIGNNKNTILKITNKIDKEMYNIDLILEKEIILNKSSENIRIKVIKVTNNKVTNFFKLLFFKILNYNNYDFSCYFESNSPICSKLALLTSSNNSIYYYNKYRNNKNIDLDDYKYIIFNSTDLKDSFLKQHKGYKDKTLVIERIDKKTELEGIFNI